MSVGFNRGFCTLFYNFITVYQARFAGDLNSSNKTFEKLVFGGVELFGSLLSPKSPVNGVLGITNNKSKRRSFEYMSNAIKSEYENIFWATG